MRFRPPMRPFSQQRFHDEPAGESTCSNCFLIADTCRCFGVVFEK